MAFIPAPNAIRICLQMEWTGQTVEICIGILKNAAVTTGDLAVVTTGMEAWRVAELRDYQSSDLAYKQWYALSLTTSTSPSLITPITTFLNGNDVADTVSNNVALVTTFQTDLRGRSYRGRAYTPGISQAEMVSPVEFLGTYAAALSTAYSTINTYLAAGFVHCVISYQNANVARTTAARTPVTGYRTEVFADSQRRRLEGRGS